MAFLNVPAPITANAAGEKVAFHLRDLDFVVTLTHWNTDTKRFVPHQGAGCPPCAAGGSRIVTRYRLGVEVDGKRHTWLMTPQAFGRLNSVIERYGFEQLLETDLVVWRTGTGIDTQYHVGVDA